MARSRGLGDVYKRQMHGNRGSPMARIHFRAMLNCEYTRFAAVHKYLKLDGDQ
jgi:hypothetical protein